MISVVVFIALCVLVISFRTYVEQFCDNMQKRSTVGLMPHESDVFARAPCYNKRASFANIAEVIAWGSREAAARDEGPFFVFVAKNGDRVEAVFLAPSHMRSGAKAPNMHAKAIAHRWVSRFIYPSFKYTVSNPNSGICSATTEGGCMYFKECGCIGAGCATLPRYTSDKLKRAQITDFWVGYEIGAPAPLIRNALPEGIEMRLTDDRRNQLVSSNGLRTLSLTRNGLLLNNGIFLAATTEPAHVIVEDGTLRMYDTAGAVQAELPLTSGGDSPYVLVLTDEGELKVLDRFDKVAAPSNELRQAVAQATTTPALTIAPSATQAINGNITNDIASTFDDTWTRNNDYERRLRQLLDWLTLRGLLKDYESKAVTFTRPSAAASLGTLDDFEDFDPQANYADRIRQLRALFA